jgi:hypothetical protein
VIPGPYCKCHIEPVDDGDDALSYFTVRYGYTSVKEARAAFPTGAREAGVSEDERCVVRAFADGDEE